MHVGQTRHSEQVDSQASFVLPHGRAFDVFPSVPRASGESPNKALERTAGLRLWCIHSFLSGSRSAWSFGDSIVSFPILIRFTSWACHLQTSVLLITVHFAMAGLPHLRPLIYSQSHVAEPCAPANGGIASFVFS